MNFFFFELQVLRLFVGVFVGVQYILSCGLSFAFSLLKDLKTRQRQSLLVESISDIITDHVSKSRNDGGRE